MVSQASGDSYCLCGNSLHLNFELCSMKEKAGILVFAPRGYTISVGRTTGASPRSHDLGGALKEHTCAELHSQHIVVVLG